MNETSAPEVSSLFCRRTIFCQSDQSKLKEALYQRDSEAGCRFWYCEDDSPDILAIGSFVWVFDPKLIGREMWQHYVQCCDEI
jgi:hypothetical protein